MAIDIKQFSALQKSSKESYFQQKKIIKQVMAGQVVICPECKKPLHLFTPESSNKELVAPGIRCKKGCSDIQLDFV